MRAFALLVLLATAVSASAQGPLTAPDARVTIPTDYEFTLHNPTAAPVALDSLVIQWGDDIFRYKAWYVGSGIPPSGVFCPFLRDQFPPGCVTDATLASGETAVVTVDYDHCAICRPAGPQQPDSLFVYAGGSAVPTRVVLDASGYVAAEPGPDGDAALTVGPNPASTRAAVRFTLAAPAASAVVAVTDALGRRLVALHDGPLAAGAVTFDADVSALPAGVYAVRLEAGGMTTTARLVVAR